MIIKLPFSYISQLSQRDRDYQLNPQLFSSFYSYEPSIEGLKKATADRNKFPVDRQILVETLRNQYARFSTTELQQHNINLLLEDNSRTIITAHQPSLFTGPLFFIYKIFSTINLSSTMKKEMPEHNFVPVFVIGSEDHDFEEINHTHLFGKKISWTTEQSGSVGRMNLNGLHAAIEELGDILGENEFSNNLQKVFKTFLEYSSTYNDFIFQLVNHLFAEYGLLVVTMDEKLLKKLFVPIMQRDLTERSSEQLVANAQKLLQEKGYSPQAFARPVNLFYFYNQQRERIVFEGGTYKVLNTPLEFSESEIIAHLHDYPENFSPNVILRPLYQELIFPNIAYIGGGGELAYWLERKSQFEHFNIFFPTLIRRNSALIVNKSQWAQIQKLGFNVKDVFKEEYILANAYLEQNADFDVHLQKETEAIKGIIDDIKKKATLADGSLSELVDAEKIKIVKQIEQIESRIKRSLKKKEEVALNQITTLKNKLTPNNGMQERNDNFFQHQSTIGPPLMDVLSTNLNPLDKEFFVFVFE